MGCPEFDFAKFAAVFPLESIPKPWIGDFVGSPESLLFTEQLRALVNQADLEPKVPCDVFVFGLGEGSDPRCTKIGGLPYRPASRPWPVGPSQRAMTFVAQYNFCKSRDLFGELPGEILLVFAEDNDISSDDPQEKLLFEWQPGEISEPLYRREDVPAPDWQFYFVYGARWRSFDCGGARAWDALASVLDSDKISTVGIDYGTQGLDRFWGMKIGGLPVSRRGGLYREPSPWNGSLLCTIATPGTSADRPHPWINQEAPISLEDSIDNYFKSLNVRAGFVMEFYLQDDGSVKWWIQFD